MTAVVAAIGETGARQLSVIGGLALFVVRLVRASSRLTQAGLLVTLRVLINQIRFTALQATGLVTMLAAILSFLVIAQSANQLGRFGALERIGTIMVVAVIRELGPLITALIVVSRSGTAITHRTGVRLCLLYRRRFAEAARRPEFVLGRQYFSPVQKMPLLEVIVTDRTAPEATATAVALGKRQGKTVIVVRDGPGFYTSRILAPYMNEAAQLLVEGAAIEEIDRALADFGFPVGPIVLLDEVGIDVGAKVAKIMHQAFGERMGAPEALSKVVEAGRLGRKSKKGFYTYDGKQKRVDPTVYDLVPGGRARKAFDRAEVAERVTLQMLRLPQRKDYSSLASMMEA